MTFRNGWRTLAVHTENSLLLWDLYKPDTPEGPWRTRQRPRRREGLQDLVALSPDARLALAGSRNTAWALIDLERPGRVTSLQRDTTLSSSQVGVFSPDGQWVALDGSRTVQINATGTGARRWEKEVAGDALGLAFAPDGKTLVSLREGAPVQLIFWDAATGKELHRAELGGPLEIAGARKPVFSADGKLLLVPITGAVELWDTTLRSAVFRVPGTGTCAVSPDGRFLAVGGGDGEDHVIRLWETATGKAFADLRGHQGEVTDLVFSPDGQLLASGSRDSTILVWDVRLDRLEGLRPARPGKNDLKACWEALGDADAAAAHRAMHGFLRRPGETVSYLREQFQPAARPSERRVKELLADLDADAFEVRDRAATALQDLHRLIEPALRQALQENPGANKRRLLERLLEDLGPDHIRLPAGTPLRAARAVWLLEALATPEARQILKRVGAGTPEAQETQAARAALQRLEAPR
jgi:hypothetical protein